MDNLSAILSGMSKSTAIQPVGEDSGGKTLEIYARYLEAQAENSNAVTRMGSTETRTDVQQTERAEELTAPQTASRNNLMTASQRGVIADVYEPGAQDMQFIQSYVRSDTANTLRGELLAAAINAPLNSVMGAADVKGVTTRPDTTAQYFNAQDDSGKNGRSSSDLMGGQRQDGAFSETKSGMFGRQAAAAAADSSLVEALNIENRIRAGNSVASGIAAGRDDDIASTQTGTALPAESSAAARSDYVLTAGKIALSLAKSAEGTPTASVSAEDFMALIKEMIEPAAKTSGAVFTTSVKGGDGESVVFNTALVQQALVRIVNSIISSEPQQKGGAANISMMLEQQNTDNGMAQLRFAIQLAGMSAAVHHAAAYAGAGVDSVLSADENYMMNLTLSSNIAKLIGGTLSVHSRRGKDGETATYLLEIPAEIAERRKSAAPGIGRFTGKKILLAENGDDFIEGDVDLLKKREMSVNIFHDGASALSAFLTSAPGTYDALILDVRLPVLDGAAVAAEIRNSPHREAMTIPILTISEDGTQEDMKQALRGGADMCLIRPFTPQALFGSIGTFVL